MAKNLEQKAREAFEFIPTSGVDKVLELREEDLKYGLEHGLFTQERINESQESYKEYSARKAFGFIPTSGVDKVLELRGEDLKYGLEHGLFTQKEINEAQEKYVCSKKRY